MRQIPKRNKTAHCAPGTYDAVGPSRLILQLEVGISRLAAWFLAGGCSAPLLRDLPVQSPGSCPFVFIRGWTRKIEQNRTISKNPEFGPRRTNDLQRRLPRSFDFRSTLVVAPTSVLTESLLSLPPSVAMPTVLLSAGLSRRLMYDEKNDFSF
jgi:hypothetical protein